MDGGGVTTPLLNFRLFLAIWGSFAVTTGMEDGFLLNEICGDFRKRNPIPLEQSQGRSKFGDKLSDCKVTNG